MNRRHFIAAVCAAFAAFFFRLFRRSKTPFLDANATAFWKAGGYEEDGRLRDLTGNGNDLFIGEMKRAEVYDGDGRLVYYADDSLTILDYHE